MRVAVLSDVHGNLCALEAVVTDIRRRSPDLVLHGGDLALMGARPDAVVDRIRELGWPGVLGNADELLWNPLELERREAEEQGIERIEALVLHEGGPHSRQRGGSLFRTPRRRLNSTGSGPLSE